MGRAKMGRMHAPGKGISQSALPYRRSVPNWLKLTSDEVKEQIFKLAKKGMTPSQIGVILGDSHGSPKYALSLATRSCVSLRLKVWPRISQRHLRFDQEGRLNPQALGKKS